jgi:recombinational DNA repair protein RecR
MPPMKSKTVTKTAKQLCHICGKESDSYFCGACSDRVRAEPLTKKKWKDKGKA